MFKTNFPFDDYGTLDLADAIIRHLEIIVFKNKSNDAHIARKVLKAFKIHDSVEVMAVVIDIACRVQTHVPEEMWHTVLGELLAPLARSVDKDELSFSQWLA